MTVRRTLPRLTRRAAVALVAAAALLTYAGAARAQGDSSAAKAPKEIRLGYFANVTHAQAVLGVHSGEFAAAAAPSALVARTFNAGPSLVEALFAGELDIGYIGPSPALAAHAKSRGEGIRVIAGAAANGVVIVARPGSGIESMSDLKGKRIATPQLGNTQDISARHFLTHELGQPNADNILPVPNAEQAAMMQRGQIDAAWAVEPWGARLVADAGAVIIGHEKDLWPGGEFTLTLVIVSPEFLKKHPAIVEKFLQVHAQWTDRLTADPQKHVPDLAAAMKEITGKELSTAILSDAISRVKFTTEPLADTMETFGQWSIDLGFSKTAPSVGTLVDRTLLDKVRAATPAPQTDTK